MCGALQDMWLIEGALEVHLGEFHVRMKGNRTGLRVAGPVPVWREHQAFLGALGLVQRVGQNPRGPGPALVSTPVTCDLGQVLSPL